MYKCVCVCEGRGAYRGERINRWLGVILHAPPPKKIMKALSVPPFIIVFVIEKCVCVCVCV
jgi:hypothetical protein